MGKLLFVLAMAFALVGCRTNATPEAQANDLRITTEVKARLADELKLATLTNVNVSTTNGVVTLSGQVESTEHKQKAAELASGVQGVTSVNNDLQVGTAADGKR